MTSHLLYTHWIIYARGFQDDHIHHFRQMVLNAEPLCESVEMSGSRTCGTSQSTDNFAPESCLSKSLEVAVDVDIAEVLQTSFAT